jgi:RNA polymerase sigma factor (sigma-70 family)
MSVPARAGAFPATRLSVLEAVRAADPERRRLAWEALVLAYWRPVYKWLRLRFRLSREDAEDLTQGFFARALEKGFFDAYDPARGRFRTFLRACLEGYAANQHAAARREKRGGGALHLALDFAAAEGELPAAASTADADPDAWFQREFVRALFAQAVADLRRRCEREDRAQRFAAFERYDLRPASDAERPSYAALAAELGTSVSQVTNHLAWARREFRRSVLETLRALTASDEEFRAEARAIFGSAP